MSAFFWLIAGINLTNFVHGLPSHDWLALGSGLCCLFIGCFEK